MYYLSGRISDPNPNVMQNNLEYFCRVEEELTKRGISVFNPAKIKGDGKSWEWYLAYCLKWINDNRPVIYLLNGWEDSRGARLEVAFAKRLDLAIIYPM